MKTFVYTGGVDVPDVTPRVPARQLLIGNDVTFHEIIKYALDNKNTK